MDKVHAAVRLYDSREELAVLPLDSAVVPEAGASVATVPRFRGCWYNPRHSAGPRALSALSTRGTGNSIYAIHKRVLSPARRIPRLTQIDAGSSPA